MNEHGLMGRRSFEAAVTGGFGMGMCDELKVNRRRNGGAARAGLVLNGGVAGRLGSMAWAACNGGDRELGGWQGALG
ncbi:hypothetical protein M0R45_036068 [Rubus argutus]|uniref:Uncharacterized protein n=1 Tax=Rubus argutus TaxID=59490 RepID=A0AAW1VW02_RUBAR